MYCISFFILHLKIFRHFILHLLIKVYIYFLTAVEENYEQYGVEADGCG